MTLWHEKLSDDDIQALKDNEKPFALLSNWQQEALDAMEIEDRERVNVHGWIAESGHPTRYGDITYRLRPDWKRPEKEQPKEPKKEPETEQVRHLLTTGTDQLSDEEIELMIEALQKILDERKEKPKEQGHWEYWEIHKYRNSMMSLKTYYGIPLGDQGWTTLAQISSLVGFGGIEFEELPGEWHMGLILLDLGDDYPDKISVVDRFGMGSPRYKPATPKRVRFWAEGEK